MLIRECFQKAVTRDIAPVVYFHEQRPEHIAAEVGEYIITGGYPPGHPKAKRMPSGIHEEFVKLLKQLERARTGEGVKLPASWISGFYGSGKSSFAKLLGLALDNRTLPDGTALAEALLAQDSSPSAAVLRKVWEGFSAPYADGDGLSTLSIVFDIGSVSRGNEAIHEAVVRELQKRLDYCPTSNLVAEHEMKLEIDSEYPAFLDAAQRVLPKPWDEMKRTRLAAQHFSAAMNEYNPRLYENALAWHESAALLHDKAGRSVADAVDAIDHMLQARASGKTLFIVIDEVSQYVHQDRELMLKLQSFVSELGSGLKGLAWLLVTGQQKLEDASEFDVLSKLKDRFPPGLRVHLSTSNIRDVVHQRLLKKDPNKLAPLRALFHEHRSLLKNFGYECRDIEEEDFLEVYPMVPEQIELLLQITTNLRSVSRRVQGDTHAVRGLLQLLGELFRAQKLADKPLGDLVTLDAIYEVLHTALEPDIQEAMRQLLDVCAKENLLLAARAAKAVALLQLVQHKVQTSRELVASCLYDRLGQGNQVDAIGEALELLRSKNLVEYTQQNGYRVQSSAGQEWQRERDKIDAPPEEWSKLLLAELDFLLDETDKPKLGTRQLPWAGLYSDGRKLAEATVGKGSRDAASVQIEFRWPTNDERKANPWVGMSAAKPDRFLVVAGDAQQTEDIARQLHRSKRMVTKYVQMKDSLRPEQHSLLHQEEANAGAHAAALKQSVSGSFLDGILYFRGAPFPLRDEGATFVSAVSAVAGAHIRKIYNQSIEIGTVTDKELDLLLKPVVSGIQQKFLDDGLGILSLENQKFVATCNGPAPKAIYAHIAKHSGLLGSMLLAEFGAPPYGYPADIVKVCVLGLLRAARVRISPDEKADITTITAPNVLDLFQLDRPFKTARLYVNEAAPLDPRTRTAIARVFEDKLGIGVEREDGALFDATWTYFPKRRQTLRKVQQAFTRMNVEVAVPEALTRLGVALEDCCHAPDIGRTLAAVKDNLDTLRDGLGLLSTCESELTDDVIGRVNALAAARTKVEQLEAYGEGADAAKDAALLRAQLARPQVWVDLAKAEAAAKRLHERYGAARTKLLGVQHAEVDGARTRLKAREHFGSLDGDQRNYILASLDRAEWETSADEVAPSLVELRDRFQVRLEKESGEANQRMDRELERSQKTVVMAVDLALGGRELSQRSELDALLKEIEERIQPNLGPNKRVRLL